MRVLVLGGGGREHAIVSALVESPKVSAVYAAPGNGGTASVATNVDLDLTSATEVVAYAERTGIGLVVIGPEAPLVLGIADELRAANIATFGPGATGAQLEGSKAFSKALMKRNDIPTGAYEVFADREHALGYVEEVGAPIVVKADGLAAGKGVIVAMTKAEAFQAVEDCFSGAFGDAGATVVIEEYLTGPECSLLVFTDGETTLPMATAQDHKRALEGDTGPNTGGMGVYSPVPIVRLDEYDEMLAIMERTVAGIRDEGIDYRGVLYGGFMLTDEGPKVLEYNARFGDPETQVILPRLETDLFEVMWATARGRLHEIELEWSDDWAVSVVLASGGYPGEYSTGLEITGIDEAEALEGVTVYHAGTKLADDGALVTSGGRVLNVTARGPEFLSARDRAYEAVERIDFEGKFFRRDIGARALRGREGWSDD